MKQLMHQNARQFPLCTVQGNPPFTQKCSAVHLTSTVAKSNDLIHVEWGARKRRQAAQDGLNPASGWMRNQ